MTRAIGTPNAPPQPLAIRAPMTSCHQARSAGSSPPRSARRSHQRGQRLAAADRDDALGDHRVAAVGEGDEGARAARGGCAAPRPPGRRRRSSGAEGSSPSSRTGRTVKTCGEPRGGSRGGGGVPIGPVVPAPGQLLDLLAQLAADEDVQLVALAQLGRAARRDRGAVADDHVDQRLARQPEFADQVAGGGRARAQAVGDDVAAHAADPARLEQPPRQRRLVGGQAEPARQRLEARALDQGRGDDDEEDDREQLLAGADAGDDREGREPDRRRAAQAGPAEHRPLAQVERREDRSRRRRRAAGRRGSGPPRAPGSSSATSPSLLGKTSRPSRMKRPIWATQPTPSWKATIVRRAGIRAEPSASAVR